ncbi:hypothetical protein LTS18_010191, partial [Coniosporium uncinatum]
MNQQQMNMGGMNAAGGPVGGMPMMNNGSRASISGGGDTESYESRLNTYIYDYLLKQEQWDLARQFLKIMQPRTKTGAKPSPGRRDVNG